jgi:hypothetical protein
MMMKLFKSSLFAMVLIFVVPALLRGNFNMDIQDIQDNQNGHVLVVVGRKSFFRTSL